jgi:hypothetical protein
MLHGLPFTVHLDHGFFNYQPNLFAALARYNSYRTHGIWVALDWTLSSFVPWQPQLLDFLVMNGKTTHLLLVLQEKMYDTEFCIPIQGVYEPMVPAASASRYQLVVDGEYYSGHRFTHVTNPPALAEPPATEPEPEPDPAAVPVTEAPAANGGLAEHAEHFPFTPEPSTTAPHHPTSIADYGGRELAKELGRRVRRRLGV